MVAENLARLRGISESRMASMLLGGQFSVLYSKKAIKHWVLVVTERGEAIMVVLL